MKNNDFILTHFDQGNGLEQVVLNKKLIEQATVGRAGTSHVIYNGMNYQIDMPFQRLVSVLGVDE